MRPRWATAVCFAGIQCGTKTRASFFLFLYHQFLFHADFFKIIHGKSVSLPQKFVFLQTLIIVAFAAMGYWKVWAPILVVCRFGNRRLHYVSLQQKYKPGFDFELPQNSVLRQHKAQYRNQNHGSDRSWDWNMHHKKPEVGMFWPGKQTKPQKCLEIFLIFSSAFFLFFFLLLSFVVIFSYAENLSVQNSHKLYK